MGKEGVEVVEDEGCEEGGVMSVKRVWLVGVWGCEGVRRVAVEEST